MREFRRLFREKKVVKDLWDEIGFHKLLSGFWFNMVYTFIGILMSSFLMGALMGWFYPFPESLGIKDVAYTTFALFFTIFDLGTANVMDRFIGEENIKDPAKLLRLIQYFIWYQMITGLIQITFVSYYALFIATKGNQAYGVWLMLVVGTTQYPGFLGVFKNVLGSLQHYNKVQTLNFLTSTLVQRGTEIIFVILGRWYGIQHPEMGDILGIAIGSAIGLYVDDFIAMVISAKFFSDTMKSYGIRAKDCLKPGFKWKDVKPVISFAIRTGTPGLIYPFLTILNLNMWLLYMPHYTTLITLASIGGSLAGAFTWFGIPSITPLVSESYLNNKPRLTQYYTGQMIRFFVLLQCLYWPILVMIYFIMPVAWEAMGMQYYLLGTHFIFPEMVMIVFNQHAGIPGQLMYGANKPNVGVILGMINAVLNSVLLAVYLIPLGLPQSSIPAFAWIYRCGGMPVSIIITIISYRYVDRKIVKIKVPWGQVVAIILSSLVMLGIMVFLKQFLFDPLETFFGFYVAVAPTVAVAFAGVVFIYVPLTGYLGAWDDINLKEFRKTAIMSGPSKIFTIPIYIIVKWACKRSPFHNRFQMSSEGIEADALDLLEKKRENREKLKHELDG
ncbi:MAG: hypothetical protein ACTSUE_12615 [Promethearchaeota archaeon]